MSGDAKTITGPFQQSFVAIGSVDFYFGANFQKDIMSNLEWALVILIIQDARQNFGRGPYKDQNNSDIHPHVLFM